MGRRQALWDLETTKTTFNNNFILRASLEQAKEKLVARGEWWILAAKNAKGAKVGGEWGMGNGERGMGNGERGTGNGGFRFPLP